MRGVAVPARGAVKYRPEKRLVPSDPIPRPPIAARPTKPKPPPRPAKPPALTPTRPPKPPPLLPPPPGPASAASVIGGIVRSMIAAVAMPLIKRALAGVAVLSAAARVGARRGGPAHQRPRQWCCARARQPRHRVQPATLAVQ